MIITFIKFLFQCMPTNALIHYLSCRSISDDGLMKLSEGIAKLLQLTTLHINFDKYIDDIAFYTSCTETHHILIF